MPFHGALRPGRNNSRPSVRYGLQFRTFRRQRSSEGRSGKGRRGGCSGQVRSVSVRSGRGSGHSLLFHNSASMPPEHDSSS